MKKGLLGIGVITYNRPDLLLSTINNVNKYTSSPHVVCVADDGSREINTIRSSVDHVVISGQNRGVSWNKNRALFYLLHIMKCETIILLEDDTQPTEYNWELDWIEASQRFGHINLAGAWFDHSFVDGIGTPGSPIISLDCSAQCCGFSREALIYAGLLDTRFKGFGYEHLEHLHRMIRYGYGGCVANYGKGDRPVYYLIKSNLEVRNPPSLGQSEQIKENETLCQVLLHKNDFRAGVGDEMEAQLMRSEIAEALQLQRSAK